MRTYMIILSSFLMGLDIQYMIDKGLSWLGVTLLIIYILLLIIWLVEPKLMEYAKRNKEE